MKDPTCCEHCKTNGTQLPETGAEAMDLVYNQLGAPNRFEDKAGWSLWFRKLDESQKCQVREAMEQLRIAGYPDRPAPAETEPEAAEPEAPGAPA